MGQEDEKVHLKGKNSMALSKAKCSHRYNSMGSDPVSVAEVPYKECFICKLDVTTVVQMKTHGNELFYYELQLVISRK